MTATGVSALCPGQGSQSVQLDRTWAETTALSEVVATYGTEYAKSVLRQQDASAQRDTCNAQVALWLEQALWNRHLAAMGSFRPSVIAGHSAGEIYALHLAGVLSEIDSFRIIEARSAAMAYASMQHPGAMMATVGLSRDSVDELLENYKVPDLWIANVNSEKQIVLSGTTTSVSRVADKISARNDVRVKILDTGGAFHSPLMESAAYRFSKSLAGIEFHEPKVVIPSNADGKIHSASEWKQLIVEQITAPVRWDLCTGVVIANSESDIELSQGKTLGRLVSRARKEI